MAGWMYRMLRLSTVVGCSVAAFAAVMATSGASEPVRERGDASVRVLQMNLCDSGHAHCYTGRSVAEASEVIRAEVPDVVTVNEVCQDDVAALEAVLTGSDGGGGGGGGRGAVVSAFQAAWDRRTGAAIRCRNGRPYGIALVARLAATPRGYDAVGGAYPMQDAGSPELRAWLCLGPRAAGSRPLRPTRPGSDRRRPERRRIRPTLGRPPSPSARHTWPAAARPWPVPSAPTCSPRRSRRSGPGPDRHR